MKRPFKESPDPCIHRFRGTVDRVEGCRVYVTFTDANGDTAQATFLWGQFRFKPEAGHDFTGEVYRTKDGFQLFCDRLPPGTLSETEIAQIREEAQELED